MNVRIFDKGLERFISSLEKQTIAKLLRTIDLLELFGSHLGMPHGKRVAPKLFELRVRGAQEVRILYTFYKNEAVLLHGFIKKTDKISQRELETALKKKQLLDSA